MSPSPNDLLLAGVPTKIWGWAWGDREISTVEVSVDGGGSWQRATVGPRENRSWQRFELPWSPGSGQHVLLCRCTKTSLGKDSRYLMQGMRCTRSKFKLIASARR
ncbi:hypothetical protein ACOJBO_02010 [Rhizobium beringeri]